MINGYHYGKKNMPKANCADLVRRIGDFGCIGAKSQHERRGAAVWYYPN